MVEEKDEHGTKDNEEEDKEGGCGKERTRDVGKRIKQKSENIGGDGRDEGK